ncbi:hypothetical protein ACTXJX_09215 [Glutamicibacter ardleyensis]|uniref:hypothetical protein n=1 Tax=Glutamicibacter ardleyensis TaxID=225894 RepID=UPI003FB88FBE
MSKVISRNLLQVDGVDISQAYGTVAINLASPNPPVATASFVSALIEISAVAAYFYWSGDVIGF